MNLDYAAYLLNENYILNEDAGSEGQKGARKWFEQNMMNMELGGMGTMTPQQFQREAEATFGHPLNDALGIRDKNVYKYLPGAVRIAVNECGWMSEHEDKKMMDNLILMYAYAYLEWKDGIAEGRPGPQRGQPYAGKYNRDFNGLRYKGLYNEIGQAAINATKTRLETANQEELSPEEQAAREAEAAARAAAEEEERRRRSTAGEYHIEFIPDYETSRQWYDYTNPKSESCGCHWCITQTRGNWDSYITNGGRCAYYCWKANSKEDLMAMNNDERWFSQWPRDQYRDAPLNEYGKSLICIMVRPGDNGKPKFAHASSRYNHYNPGGDWDSSSRYGDGMVPQGERGFQEILGILGITADEFYEKFPFRTADGEQAVDHSAVYTTLNNFKERAASVRGQKLFNLLHHTVRDVSTQGENFIKINDNGEYNFVNSNGNLLSPTRWFKETRGNFADRNAVGVRFKNPQGVWVWNLLDKNGNLLLAKNVHEVIFDENANNNKYVKIGIIIGDDEFYNIINIDNGNLLLRKPVYDVALTGSYSSSIPVKETRESDWSLIDLKGKKININVPIKGIRTAISLNYRNGNGKTFIYADINRNGKSGIISKKLNRLIYTLANNETVFAMNMYGFVIKSNNNYKLYNDKGDLLYTLSNGNRIYLGEDCRYAWFKSRQLRFYDIVENREISDIATDNASVDDCRGYRNFFAVNRKLYFNGQEIANDLYSRTIVPLKGAFKDLVYVESESGKSLFNAVTGERLETKCRRVYTSNDNYIAVLTEDSTLITYDENFNELDRMTYVSGCSLLNFDCVLARQHHTGLKPYNIIGPDGYRLFELNFDDILTAGFDQEGIAAIKCGNNDYFINIEGDVSRARELMAESMQSKFGPMLMEYSVPKAKAKFNWHNIAANLLD